MSFAENLARGMEKSAVTGDALEPASPMAEEYMHDLNCLISELPNNNPDTKYAILEELLKRIYWEKRRTIEEKGLRDDAKANPEPKKYRLVEVGFTGGKPVLTREGGFVECSVKSHDLQRAFVNKGLYSKWIEIPEVTAS